VNDAPEIVIEETMKAGVHRARRLSLTEGWVKAGKIAPELHQAAVRYSEDFNRARLRGNYGSLIGQLERVDASPGRRERLVVSEIAGKQQIALANEAAGQEGTAVLWDVIGCEMSLREHAQRQSWNGRPLNVHEVKGRLIAALGTLATHYERISDGQGRSRRRKGSHERK